MRFYQSPEGENVLMAQIRNLFKVIARLHKNYNFVFILDMETSAEPFALSYWEGIAQV